MAKTLYKISSSTRCVRLHLVILLEQESIRADAARVTVLDIIPHCMCEICNCAISAHANVWIAAGVPALLAAECGDGLGLLAALALAL